MSRAFSARLAAGDRIRAARVSKGMTQAQIAQQLGVMQGVMSSIERGRSKNLLDLHTPKLCEILGLNQDELMQEQAMAAMSPRRKAEFEERLERIEERQIRIEALLEKLISVKRL